MSQANGSGQHSAASRHSLDIYNHYAVFVRGFGFRRNMLTDVEIVRSWRIVVVRLEQISPHVEFMWASFGYSCVISWRMMALIFSIDLPLHVYFMKHKKLRWS